LLEVIGAGFSRTGTMSLKRALEILGVGRCYHFTELLKRRHVARWLAIANGGPADWDELFAGYAAAVDWPAAAYYRELADHYPDAKVILTIRDPGEWHSSLSKALLPLRRSLTQWLPWKSRIARLTDEVIWDGTFAGRAHEREFAVARFLRHTGEVRAVIDSKRLLVFDVKEGWEPLCRFLGRPVPGVPFPRANRRSTIRAATWLMTSLKIVAIALLLALLLGLLAALPSWG
jgi:hypothetical protein